MNCNETETFLHGYLDGELDLARSLEVEHHLQDCAACAQIYKSQQALRAALRAGGLSFPPPARLENRIRAAVRKDGKAESRLPAISWRWLSAAGTLACLLIVVWGLGRVWPVSSTDDLLAREVTASHVRSLMASHLEDVPSSDKHTVKPWFAGKLDFSPPVDDLAGQGFPLIGGRLDYLDNRPVAALVYGRHKHIINLFLWPSTPGPDTAVSTVTRQGYHLVHWTQAGMTYWAVSDLNDSELQQFARLIQKQAP